MNTPKAQLGLIGLFLMCLVSSCVDHESWEDIEPTQFIKEIETDYGVILPKPNVAKYEAASHGFSRGEFVVMSITGSKAQVDGVDRMLEMKTGVRVEYKDIAEQLSSLKVSENIAWWSFPNDARAKVYPLKPASSGVIFMTCYILGEQVSPKIILAFTPNRFHSGAQPSTRSR